MWVFMLYPYHRAPTFQLAWLKEGEMITFYREHGRVDIMVSAR